MDSDCWQELLEKVSSLTIADGTLARPSLKLKLGSPITPLRRAEYPAVKYWLESDYKTAMADSAGDTDVFGAKRKQGRPTKEEGPALGPYLEDANGNPMSAERLTSAGDKFRSLANTLLEAGMAPPSWKKRTNDAYNFVHTEMKREFIEFALCDGDWKAEIYFTTEYPRWSRHKPGLSPDNTETKKRKLSVSVGPGLLKMEDWDTPSTVRFIDSRIVLVSDFTLAFFFYIKHTYDGKYVLNWI